MLYRLKAIAIWTSRTNNNFKLLERRRKNGNETDICDEKTHLVDSVVILCIRYKKIIENTMKWNSTWDLFPQANSSDLESNKK